MAHMGGRPQSGLRFEHAAGTSPNNTPAGPGNPRARADVITLWRDIIPSANLEDVRSVLERKLAWYGLQSVRLGRFHWRGDGALFVDVVSREGDILDRIAIDRECGGFRPTRGQALRLMEHSGARAGRPVWWAAVGAA